MRRVCGGAGAEGGCGGRGISLAGRSWRVGCAVRRALRFPLRPRSSATSPKRRPPRTASNGGGDILPSRRVRRVSPPVARRGRATVGGSTRRRRGRGAAEARGQPCGAFVARRLRGPSRASLPPPTPPSFLGRAHLPQTLSAEDGVQRGRRHFCPPVAFDVSLPPAEAGDKSQGALSGLQPLRSRHNPSRTRSAWRPMEAITSRRQVRTYRPDPIPDEVLRQILEAGRRAPSGFNRQPWTSSWSPIQRRKQPSRRPGRVHRRA